MSRALAHCGHDLAALDRRDRFMAARDRPFGTCDVFLAPTMPVRLACGGRRTRRGQHCGGLSGQRVPRGGHRSRGHLGRVIGRAKPATAPPACASGLLAQHRIGQLERCIGALARAPIHLSAECRQQPVRTIILDLAFDLRRKAAILAAYCHGDTPDLRTIFVYGQAPQRLNNEISARSVNQRGQWAL